jgi:hypothetical protein
MAGLLTSAISANKLSRQRTIADQAAMEQIEYVRRLQYDDVGILLGNPPGVVSSPTSVTVTGLKYTVTTQIKYIDDPTPTSYETTANYKRVTVTVTRDDDGKVLAREVTYVAPSSRTPFGGVNLATIQPLVIDYGLNVPVENVAVGLLTGPSAPRNDTTDTTGKVSFPKLTPNATAICPPDCYDLTATLFGYVQLDAPLRVNIGAGQTATPTLQIYRPATINVFLQDTLGSPYTGPVSLKMTSARNGATQTFSVSGGSAAITAVNGEQIVPSVQYTADAWTTGVPLCATPVTKYVPDNYPSVMTSTFTLVLGACPAGSVVVTVTWGGVPAPGATVTLSGGPYGLTPVTGTTNALGVVTFTNVPSGAGYTVQATKSGQSATPQTISVATGVPTNVAMALPTGTLIVRVQRNGSNFQNATIRVQLGPNNVNLVGGPTPSSGLWTFNNVPVGTGYTIKAWSLVCTISNPKSGTLTGQTVNTGTTNLTLNFGPPNTCPLP